jgi:hypothetical protein
MGRVSRLPADEVVYVGIGRPCRLKSPPRQCQPHLLVIRRLVDGSVFALGVEEHHGRTNLLVLHNLTRDGGGLTAAGGTQNTDVPR